MKSFRHFLTEEDTTVRVNGRSVRMVKSERAKRNRAVLVPINVAIFDAAWARQTGFYISRTGTNQIGTRLDGLRTFLLTAVTLEAPSVVVDADGSVAISDGRHRFALLRDSGVPRVWVTMDKQSFTHARAHNLIAK